MERAGPHQIIAITDSRICKGDLLERIELLAQSGVRAIILREKQLGASEYRALAEQSLAICARAGVACILHSFIEVARELKASALHCQSSQIAHLPRLRREFATLGVSVHSVEEYKAAREWVDYVIVGHIFASACKEGVEPKGLKLLESIITLESNFARRDSACGLESRISSPRCFDRRPSLISLRGSKNHDSSSTILESQSSFTKQTENLESTFEKQAECEKVDSSPALQGLYAIGGISLETLPLLHHLPISGVCMRQTLMQTPNPEDYIRDTMLL
ncbi:thiamine phosphate synthase [Helicobacter canis]|uniref:Thiamine phosphate synthase n=1 Tax=Helicobacter canis TaxID=29419 RepID=A0A5M9QV13_9HELI|nr:thiamine phosphate synthase [Helicobacter canis]KAA8710935.1 thiamine phosphate synthase [Helicobacter canis]